jgi:hypothetical protein
MVIDEIPQSRKAIASGVSFGERWGRSCIRSEGRPRLGIKSGPDHT